MRGQEGAPGHQELSHHTVAVAPTRLPLTPTDPHSQPPTSSALSSPVPSTLLPAPAVAQPAHTEDMGPLDPPGPLRRGSPTS